MTETQITISIDTERLKRIEQLQLLSGAHQPPGKDGAIEACVMEAVAFVAGEPWSDHPRCADPGIAGLMRRWNDRIGDELRQDLKRFIPRLVGSKASREIEVRRAWLAADAAMRIFAPFALDKLELPELAAKMRALPETTTETAGENRKVARSVWKEAYDARYAVWLKRFKERQIPADADAAADAAAAAAAAADAADADAADAAADAERAKLYAWRETFWKVYWAERSKGRGKYIAELHPLVLDLADRMLEVR